ncbi:Asp/Glu/hydantoin racemase [Xylariaceae sp. FL0016]|nr:Asp/Glu/hydantoin racemase [Xylariaceae sp. FL0016]
MTFAPSPSPFKPVRGRTTKILILNPNSSQAMTDGMQAIINNIQVPYSTEVHTYTAPPSSPASINDGHDIQSSTTAVLSDPAIAKNPELPSIYDGILVACFSVHPLVPKLQTLAPTSLKPGAAPAVTGIFESSVLTALSLLGPSEKWGIVTTGKFWEDHLSRGVAEFLGFPADLGDAAPHSKFAGVESTGLNAGDFHHGVDPAIIRRKLVEATKRLFESGNKTMNSRTVSGSPVTCIVMGCAGMAGLEEIIRSAASELYGGEFAYKTLHVVDGVRAGIMQIEQTIKHRRLRDQ